MKFTKKEIGEIIPLECASATLKDIILNSNEYKKDPNFVEEIRSTVVTKTQKRKKDKT